MSKCFKCNGWFVTGEIKIFECGNVVHERCVNEGWIASDSAQVTAAPATFQDKLAAFCRKSYEAIVRLEELQIEILARFSTEDIYDRNYDFHIKPFLIKGLSSDIQELLLMSAEDSRKIGKKRKHCVIHRSGKKNLNRLFAIN